MSAVPAWKRLGLKLKGPAPAPAPNPQSSPSSTQAFPHGGPHHTNGLSLSSPSFATKRKLPPPPASPQKKARYDPSASHNGVDYDNSCTNATPAPKKRKSVAFAPDTKLDATTPSAKWTPATAHRQRTLVNGSDSSPAPANKSKPKKKKKSKGPAKKLKPVPAPNLDAALAYLRTWKADRAHWKFNKNHQTSLLRHLLSPPDPNGPSGSTIPAEDIPTILEYIQGLKGFVRTRLREAAEEVKRADMAPHTSTHKGFPEGTEDAAALQAEYDDIIQTLLTQPPTPGLNNPRYSFSFSETEFHREYAETNTLVSRRVVKRMRAEMVLGAIASDSDASEASAATTETRDNEREPTGKRVKLNDGTLRQVKRKRKLRTADIESDSSSDESSSSSGDDSENDADSESESDSEENADNEDDEEDTSSSENNTSSSEDGTSSNEDGTSSSEEDHDEEEEMQEGAAEVEATTEDAETSSSSSESSSSSDSESDGDVAEGTEKIHGHEAHETSSSSESSDAGGETG